LAPAARTRITAVIERVPRRTSFRRVSFGSRSLAFTVLGPFTITVLRVMVLRAALSRTVMRQRRLLHGHLTASLITPRLETQTTRGVAPLLDVSDAAGVSVAGEPPTGHPAVRVSRLTNNAGGLEGGVTNGEQLRVTGYMKPIATLMQPLRSVDLTTLAESPAAIERSDVCAVTAAAVVGEAMVSLVVADAFLEKFTGDNLADITRAVDAGTATVRARFAPRQAPDPAPARS